MRSKHCNHTDAANANKEHIGIQVHYSGIARVEEWIQEDVALSLTNDFVSLSVHCFSVSLLSRKIHPRTEVCRYPICRHGGMSRFWCTENMPMMPLAKVESHTILAPEDGGKAVAVRRLYKL